MGEERHWSMPLMGYLWSWTPHSKRDLTLVFTRMKFDVYRYVTCLYLRKYNFNMLRKGRNRPRPFLGVSGFQHHFQPLVLYWFLISIKFAIQRYIIWPYLRNFNFKLYRGGAKMGHALIWAFRVETPLGSQRFLKVLYQSMLCAKFGTSITKMHDSALRDLTICQYPHRSKFLLNLILRGWDWFLL